MNTDIFMQNLHIGITITVIGMLVVLFFLTITIGAINVTTKIIQIINKYFPEEIPEEPKKKVKKQNEDEEIALAIALAVQKNGGI